MPQSDLFTLPSASSTFAYLGTWSSPMFNEFLPLVFLVAGIAIGALVVVFIIYALIDIFERVVHGKEDRFK